MLSYTVEQIKEAGADANIHAYYVDELLKSLEELFPQEQKQNFCKPDVSGRSEQLKCECSNAEFTRMVDADYNPLCGRCGRAL